MKKLKKYRELTRNQEIVVLRTKTGRCCLTDKKFKIDGQNTLRDYSMTNEIPEMENLKESTSLKEEVKKAIDTLYPEKAPGEDEITSEMLQASDEIGTEKNRTDLCNKIYDTGYIPDDMRKSTFIQIPKKTKAINQSTV